MTCLHDMDSVFIRVSWFTALLLFLAIVFGFSSSFCMCVCVLSHCVQVDKVELKSRGGIRPINFSWSTQIDDDVSATLVIEIESN